MNKTKISIIVTVLVLALAGCGKDPVKTSVKDTPNSDSTNSIDVDTKVLETSEESDEIRDYTKEEIEIEFSQKVTETYMEDVEFKVLDFERVDSSYYNGVPGDNVTRVIVYGRNALRLTNMDVNTEFNKIILNLNNMTSPPSWDCFNIANSYDVLFVYYYDDPIEFNESDIRNITLELAKTGVPENKVYLTKELSLQSIEKINDDNIIKLSTIHKIADEHFVFITKTLQAYTRYDEFYEAIDPYNVLEWGNDYTSVMESNFEVVDKSTMEATNTPEYMTCVKAFGSPNSTSTGSARIATESYIVEFTKDNNIFAKFLNIYAKVTIEEGDSKWGNEAPSKMYDEQQNYILSFTKDKTFYINKE